MTRIFTRHDVRSVIAIDDVIGAVESVFRQFGEGSLPPPSTLGVPVECGGFHLKAAAAGSVFVAKINANFPSNPRRHGLPVIQGVAILFDAACGTPLAILDSMEITALRTAAASAVAAKHLARPDASVLTICGCGVQGRAHVEAISRVRPIRRVFAVDSDPSAARDFGGVVADLDSAIAASDIVVTTTPSKQPFIRRSHLRPGLFIAAVGADNPEKSEISPDALAATRVVVDVREQAATMGDLHHALAAATMRLEDVYADLGEIVSGKRAGRTSADQIFVFDSTGTALQDVAVAELVYRRGTERGSGLTVAF